MKTVSKALLCVMLTVVMALSCLPAIAAEAPALPTATVSTVPNDELTFAMNFKADPVTDEQLAYYGDWYADFELTFNKEVTMNANGSADGFLAGQYDAWSKNWVYVPGTDVTLEANKPLKIMEYASKLMNKEGLKYTYEEVYTAVKDFDCGVYLTDEFLAANPDLVVTLELRAYNNENESENYLIGETYTFTADYVAKNTATGALYMDVSAALMEAEAGQTVALLKTATDDYVSIYEDTTLDLAGNTLTAKYVTAYGHIIDSDANNAGLLVVAPNRMMVQSNNQQVPIHTGTGYAFAQIHEIKTATLADGRYAFQVFLERPAHQLMKQGAQVTGTTVQVDVAWEQDGHTRTQQFVYSDAHVALFLDSYNASTNKYSRMFTLGLAGTENFTNLTTTAVVVSDTGVRYTAAAKTEGNVSTNSAGQVTESVTLTNEQGSAVVATGTQLEQGAKNLTLTTTEMERTTSNVQLQEGEALRSMDVHVEGISADNTVPVIVTLKELAAAGLNEGNIALYHVENGETVEMTRVYSIEEVDAHNEYYYDIETGTVTVALASFSEVALVANEENIWDGVTKDTSWYKDPNATSYEIYNADQLAGLGKLVDEGNTFEGKTVTLCMDVKLSDGSHSDDCKSFNPIGYGYEFIDSYTYADGNGTSGRVFKGTFDGNGNTIYNLYQNGWALENNYEDYTNSMAGGGLFASVVDATVKNLTMDNAYIVMECVDMGVAVGYANGNCTFENIVVKNSTIANYQRCTGGAIGEVGNGHHILKNVDVDADTVVSSLWGDFDAPLGGIIGGKWGHSYNDVVGQDGHTVSVYMENCDVAAEINAYNDVTSAYQWYSYRRAGMLIGLSEEAANDNGRNEATASYLTTKDCTVQYGDWVNYHYCRFSNTTSRNGNYPWVRVESSEFNGAYSNPRYGVPTFDGAELDIVNHADDANCHVEADINGYHHIPIVFNQLYGGGQGCYGGNSHVGNGVTVLSENNIILNPTQKFTATEVRTIAPGTITLGELFTGTNIVDKNVYAFVSPADEGSDVVATSVSPVINGDWTQYTLNISGTGLAKITISDYYYCEPTTIYVTVAEPGASIDQAPTGCTLTYNGQAQALVSGGQATGGTLVYSADNGETFSEEIPTATNAGTYTIKYKVVSDSGYAASDEIFELTSTIAKAQAIEINTANLTNYGKFLYRVGNGNAIELDYLFAAKDAYKDIDLGNLTATASGATVTVANTTLDTITAKFDAGFTGPTTLTISGDNIESVSMPVEVVTANNVTSAPSTTTGGNYVLLCDISTTAYRYYWNSILYGNGFTYSLAGAPNGYSSGHGHGILILDNATFDNVVIIGDIYDSYGAFSTQSNYNAAIDTKGKTTIKNCYIANCATPVRTRADTTIIDSTLYGGAVANLIINSGTVTLENVTTANYSDGRKVVGLGIVASPEATDAATLVLNGTLTQYNYISEANKPTDTAAKALYDEIFADQCKDYHIGTSPNRYINTGIASMSEKFTIEDVQDNANTGYSSTNVELNSTDGFLYSSKQADVPNVNNNYNQANDTHIATAQGAIAPTCEPDHSKNEQSIDETHYCKGSNYEVTISMSDGESFVWNTDVLTIQKNGEVLDYTVTMNDTECGGTITFTEPGVYKVNYTYVDENNYRLNNGILEQYSQKYIQTVTVTVAVVKAQWKDAEITIKNTAMSGIYVMSGDYDYSYKMKFLDCITITDYDEAGNASTVDLSSGIASTSFIDKNGANPGKFDANSGTITINYTSGKILTVKIGAWSGSGPSTKTCSVKTDDGVYLITDGASNAANTGVTWKITGYTYTGNSGAIVSDSTTITFTWDTNSDGYSSKDSGTCFTPDTMITLADGTQKRIDQLTFGDKILAWDFFTGTYVAKEISLLVNHGEALYNVANLQFSDGSVLRIIAEHGVFDYDLNKFVYITVDNMAQFVGHRFVQYAADGSYNIVTLTDAFETQETTTAWSVSSAGTSNAFASGLLTVAPPQDFYNWIEMGDKLMYNVEQFQQDVETYGLYTYEDFQDYVTYEQFIAWNGAYLKIPVEKGYFSFDYILELIETYKSWMPAV